MQTSWKGFKVANNTVKSRRAVLSSKSSMLLIQVHRIVFINVALDKQAENGLQMRSSKNGKSAVWHYGFKLQ